MSKVRYNVLRMSLGCFLGVMGIKAIKDFDTLSAAELVALSLGIFAAVLNYWPEKKNPKNAGNA